MFSNNATLGVCGSSPEDGEVPGVDAAAVDEKGVAGDSIRHRLPVYMLVPDIGDLM